MRMLTVSEAARVLGIARSTLYAMVDARKIKHYRIGNGRGSIRFATDELNDYLESCRVDPCESAAETDEASRAVNRADLKHLKL